MTMAYSDAATTAADPGFQSRVRAALFASCARIGSGDFVDATQQRMYRSLMASIVRDPDLYVTTFTWVLAAYCGLTVDSTDTDLDTAITQLWPAVSGYIAAGGPA